MRRVCVVGNTASGKSHLAALIGEAFGLPVIHLDAVYWKPDWSHVPREDFLAAQQDLIGQERWVLDGCFSEFGLLERFRTADAVVFLDMPTWPCLRRAVSRRGDHSGALPADDRKLPVGLGLLFLTEIVLFKLLERPRILSAAKSSGTHFIRLRQWSDEDNILSELRDFESNA
jgi:hypothetical protein